jgi:hypothetical protein
MSVISPSHLRDEVLNSVCRLFQDVVQLGSGLVDLFKCVGRYSGGGHRPALTGERFVGLVTEDPYVHRVFDRAIMTCSDRLAASQES